MQPTDTWPVGEWLAVPTVRTTDDETGVEYDVLTGGVGNNTHVYFNRANFTGDGKHIVFCRRAAAGRNDVCLIQPCDEDTRR